MMSAISLEQCSEFDRPGVMHTPKVLGRGPRFPEALGLPAEWLAELPLPPSMALHVQGVVGVVRIELDDDAARVAREEGDLVVDADEWRNVALGAQSDRLWQADFAALCRRKRAEPAFRIDRETALAGARPDRNESWTVARVLERVGAEVLTLELP